MRRSLCYRLWWLFPIFYLYLCSFQCFRVWDKGPRPDSVCGKAQTLLWAALVGCRVKTAAVEAAKFVGSHVWRVAPTATAWAHRHFDDDEVVLNVLGCRLAY